MDAIRHIINLDNAETVEEMDQEMLKAHEAVNNLHLEKLKELKDEVNRRLGVQGFGSLGNVSTPMYSPPTDESLKERRSIRDNPQA